MQQGGRAEKEPEDLAEKQLCFPMPPRSQVTFTLATPPYNQPSLMGLRHPVGVRKNPLGNLTFTKNSHFSYSNILNKCI